MTVLDDAPVSEMRNLGPAVEKDLKAAGVNTAGEVRKLGTEAAFIRMLEGRLVLGRSASCANALYLYSIYGAIHDVDWRDLSDAKKNGFKALSAEIRDSGRFDMPHPANA
jgi:DNA transformation protein